MAFVPNPGSMWKDPVTDLTYKYLGRAPNGGYEFMLPGKQSFYDENHRWVSSPEDVANFVFFTKATEIKTTRSGKVSINE